MSSHLVVPHGASELLGMARSDAKRSSLRFLGTSRYELFHLHQSTISTLGQSTVMEASQYFQVVPTVPTVLSTPINSRPCLPGCFAGHADGSRSVPLAVAALGWHQLGAPDRRAVAACLSVAAAAKQTRRNSPSHQPVQTTVYGLQIISGGLGLQDRSRYRILTEGTKPCSGRNMKQAATCSHQTTQKVMTTSRKMELSTTPTRLFALAYKEV